MITIIIALAASWTLAAIVLPPIILPNFYLRKQNPDNSKIVQKISNKLKAKTKRQTLQNIFNFITKNYVGKEKRYKVAFYPKLFKSNVTKNLEKPNQFLACHLQNLLLRDLLLASGQFRPEDITIKLEITKYVTVHQYLIVNTGNSEFYADPFYELRKLA